MAGDIPSEHRALVLTSTDVGLELKTPQLGNVLVRVEAASLLSYHREIYNGARQYPQLDAPHAGGYSAVGRVAAVGADATALTPGQLVFADCTMRSRDGAGWFLVGVQASLDVGGRRLNADVYRDGAFAEYWTVPLENCHPLDEARLTQGLGYTTADLAYLSYLLVAYGGLRDISLEPGETPIVCPATGGFGGAGVLAAIAMGSRVIAMGRNEKELARLKAHVMSGNPGSSGLIETVRITGDEAADTAALQAFGLADAVLDFSPPHAAGSSHLRCAIRSLRREGRVSLMGLTSDFAEYVVIINNLTLKGKVMYERDDVTQFVKMLERGLLPRGESFVDTKVFKLEQAKEALHAAAEHTGCGRAVVFAP
ncbi:hypothetical protein PG994_000523 [Apiospora phragmitis]|uniref:Alcohol dehydrogenase-like N-terminal domain-containing protein n=1 Tax=Apiospora phragmitis TaxID=2905665 RepID=A0ABR1X6I7_9PEZI